jgi:hypothetical protein
VRQPPVASAFDSATLLEDGRVVLAGGGPQVVVHDPKTNTWTAFVDLPGAREQALLAALPDGRLVIAGGLAEGLTTDASLLFRAVPKQISAKAEPAPEPPAAAPAAEPPPIAP